MTAKKKWQRPKPRVFYLHFNKNAMQRKDPKVWSIQTSRGCFHATRVIATVPLETVFKPTRKQNPRAFLKGWGVGEWVTFSTGEEVLMITPMGTELESRITWQILKATKAIP